MENVVTLIAVPGTPLTLGLVRSVQDALAAAGARMGTPDWLAPGAACDIPLDAIAAPPAERAVRAAAPCIDVVVQQTSGRRKRLFVADMDSTIIGQECLDEVAATAGLGPKVAELTRRAMAGEIDFAAALRERVALFRGLPLTLLDQVMRDSVRLNPGASILLATLRAHGCYTALVSGGFTYFTERVARMAGFDTWNGNVFGTADGTLTGEIAGPIGGAEAKREMLERLMAERGVVRSETLAAGDGANDILMLQAAGLGVAYHGKPRAREAAAARIDSASLTALLFVQGYRAAEFTGGD